MMNENIENSIVELEEEALELVSGGKDTYRIKASEVNVRSGPGKDFAVTKRLKKGAKVTYLGEKKKDKDGKTWLYIACIEHGYVNGWIRSDLLK